MEFSEVFTVSNLKFLFTYHWFGVISFCIIVFMYGLGWVYERNNIYIPNWVFFCGFFQFFILSYG
jgi:hypothetical protein